MYTTGGNASSTKPQGLVGYVEDAGIRAEDKCRYGDMFDRERLAPGTRPLNVPEPRSAWTELTRYRFPIPVSVDGNDDGRDSEEPAAIGGPGTLQHRQGGCLRA